MTTLIKVNEHAKKFGFEMEQKIEGVFTVFYGTFKITEYKERGVFLVSAFGKYVKSYKSLYHAVKWIANQPVFQIWQAEETTEVAETTEVVTEVAETTEVEVKVNEHANKLGFEMKEVEAGVFETRHSQLVVNAGNYDVYVYGAFLKSYRSLHYAIRSIYSNLTFEDFEDYKYKRMAFEKT